MQYPLCRRHEASSVSVISVMWVTEEESVLHRVVLSPWRIAISLCTSACNKWSRISFKQDITYQNSFSCGKT
jgi:hypothetical protein